MRIPKTLGACADLLYTLRARRLAAEKKVKDAREKETLLADHIINLLPKSQLTGVAGKIARATITKKEFAKAYDWDALYKHIAETGSFDLLERRISRGAARARWLQEEDIPGVEKFVQVDVHISKLGGS